MGFLSFSLDYYRNELQMLESAPVGSESVYHAQQLLKMLDDLLDEGYPALNEALESAFQGVSRLRYYLKANNSQPFPVFRKDMAEMDVAYGQKQIELSHAIDELTASASERGIVSDDDFLAELIRFCEWIGYEENTAYIFLLRDTLLPYIYYQSKHRAHIQPWLLGRKTLTKLTGKDHADDAIRASIFKALEQNKCSSYEAFCETVLPDIRATLNLYPEILHFCSDLLGSIPQTHILVIESGCSGTFPMLLKSIDDRVDIRMYTTYPYLLNAYGNRIYSPKYENNRLFETLYSQDLYFQFFDCKDGHFYVRKCMHDTVTAHSCAEVNAIQLNTHHKPDA